MKKLLLSFLVTIFTVNAFASIDTINIYSKSMFKDIKCVVVTPANYHKTTKKFPVVYLLHGYSGSYNNWVQKVNDIQQLADENQLLIVTPHGDYGSWYFDSPVDLTSRYETHVSTEIPDHIDAVYRTIKNRNARAITGLSMGGHGAMFIAFRHADKFGACGSMSGALMVHTIKKGYHMPQILGDTIVNQEYYNNWSVYNVIEKYPTDSLAIILDCGRDDFIFHMSKQTHEKMVRLNIPHDYIERPGKHDWPYWNKAVRYQLLFFKEYFKRNVQQ